MAINDADYPNGQAGQEAKLGALGFDASGHRGGGIERPIVVTLPANAVLLRLYRPVLNKGDTPGDFGAWWFTPFEYRRICDYFGVDGSALVRGRSAGASARQVYIHKGRQYQAAMERLLPVNALTDSVLGVAQGAGAGIAAAPRLGFEA